MEGLQIVHSSNFVSEGSEFELNLHTLSCEKFCTKDEQSTCCNMIGNVENTLQQESSYCSVLNKDSYIGEEVGAAEFFRLHNSHEQFKEIGECKELITFDITTNKCFRKSATFPSSEVGPSLLAYTNINEASTSSPVPIQNSSGDQLPTFKRSTSLPASSKPVSAMKGGRAQNGSLPRMDVRVKWALEVYDPPTTLMSHTVKKNHQRPKSNKKDNRNQKKHNKGKNSRGNSSGKKRGDDGSLHVPIPSKYAPPQPWLKAGGSNGSGHSESDGNSAIEILEFAVVGIRDVKCGDNIILRESLAKLHLSFGEAS